MVGLSTLDLCLQEAQGFLTTGIGSTLACVGLTLC